MAEIIRTVGASSRDHVDLDAAITWLTTNAPDFAVAGNNYILRVHNDSPTMIISSTLPNYNQTATFDLVIEGVAGTNGSGRPELISTANSTPTFNHNSQHTTIRDIVFRNTSNTSNSHCLRYNTGTGPGNIFRNCSFESGIAGGSNSFETLQPDTNNKPRLEFCVMRNAAQYNFHAISSAGAILLYCILENAGSNNVNKLSDFDPVIAVNCSSYGAGGSDWAGSAAGFAGSETNASSDTTAPGTTPVTNLVAATAYVNAAGGDYTPAPGSPLTDVGTDTSVSYGISTDVNGIAYAPNYDISPIAAVGSSTSNLTITLTNPPPNGTYYVEAFTGAGSIFTGAVTVTLGVFTLTGLNTNAGTAVDGHIKDQNQINANNGTYFGGNTVSG